MPNQNPILLPLSSDSQLAAAPYVDQYFGAWALWEPKFQGLVDCAQNLNLQLHLEHHAPATAAEVQAAVMASDGLAGVPVTRDGIAVIELNGTLMKHASSFSGGTSTVRARRQIRAAAASDDIVGILLAIDSPGGTVAGTEELAADIRAAGKKKPVWSHIEDLCASAGYWHASQAQRIVCGPAAIVGSIGVFSVVVDAKKAAEEKGYHVHVIRFGKFKGAGVAGTEITEEQLARWQRIVDAHGEDFVATVAGGRRMTVERVRELADGDVHKGDAAKKHGLVDAIGSLDETVAALVAETRKPRSPSRSKAMSENTTTAAEPQAPKAATLAELKEHCPGATSDFLLAQMEAAATVPQAMKAHMKAQADANAALVKERDELKAKNEAAPAKGQRGTAPIGGTAEETDATEFEGGANEFAQAEIEKRVAGGMTRDRAAKATFRAHPMLREAMVAEANEGRGRRAG